MVPYRVSRSPELFYDLLAREGVTVLNQTPSAFRQLIWAEKNAPNRIGQLKLRYVIFGGEALELQSLRPWFETHPDDAPLLVNMYGITETTVHVTYRPIRLGRCRRESRQRHRRTDSGSDDPFARRKAEAGAGRCAGVKFMSAAKAWRAVI